MLQFTDSILDPFVWFYNLGSVAVLLLFIYQEKTVLHEWIKKGNLKKWWLFFAIWTILSLILNIFVLGSDVDDAIISGTKAFVNDGANPYIEQVVVHLVNGDVILGLYHYFPSDLFIYSLIYLLFGWLDFLFPNSWYFIGNVLFLTIGYFFSNKIVEIEHKRLIPIYGFITCFFLFTNSSLMAMYFTIGFYFFKNRKNIYLGIISYIFAAGVKYITGLFLAIHIIDDLRSIKSINESKVLFPYVIGGLIFIILILPFGVTNVLNATFIYQGEINARREVAGIYGPLFVEIALLFNIIEFYTEIFLVLAFISLIVSYTLGKNTYEKQILLSFLFLFILPFYGTEFAIAPLLLWLYSIFGKEYNYEDSQEK